MIRLEWIVYGHFVYVGKIRDYFLHHPKQNKQRLWIGRFPGDLAVVGLLFFHHFILRGRSHQILCPKTWKGNKTDPIRCFHYT